MKNKEIILNLPHGIFSEIEKTEIESHIASDELKIVIWEQDDLIPKAIGKGFIILQFIAEYELFKTIIQSAFYESFKFIFLKVWSKISNNKATSKRLHPDSFVINIRKNNDDLITFVFEGDLSDALKSKCIDEAFQVVDKLQIFQKESSDKLLTFNQETQVWE